MSKSTITITDDGKQVKVEVAHDPEPAGPRPTWHVPARTADALVRKMMEAGRKGGQEPFLEIVKNAMTGHVDVTTRRKENNESNDNDPGRIDNEAAGDGTGGRN